MLCISLIAIPAQAFTINSLDVEVFENGDCNINFDYKMTFVEYIGYYTNIASPADEIRKELDKRTSRPVEIISVSPSEAKFKVFEYAKVTHSNGNKVYTVPSISFSKAEEILNEHWISKITSFDLSPEKTEVKFPDGYIETYQNQMDIPQIVHKE